MEGKDIQKGPKLGTLQMVLNWNDLEISMQKKQKWPTNSCYSVIFALGEDHHSLPLCVVLGEVLGLPGNLCNVISL